MENTINDAIRLAIEKGGYDQERITFGLEGIDFGLYEMAVLDPLFWQSLGKALGWTPGRTGLGLYGHPEWQVSWHRFIDHLAEGKDPDEFFKQLINA